MHLEVHVGRYQAHTIIKHARNVACNGEIREVPITRDGVTEVHSQCEKCGWNPDLQPVVLKETQESHRRV